MVEPQLARHATRYPRPVKRSADRIAARSRSAGAESGMKLYKKLSKGLLEAHPEDAARVLEGLPEEDTLAVLAATPAPVAAETLRRMAIHRAASLLAKLERPRAAAIVETLTPDVATNVLRRMDVEARDALVGDLNDVARRALTTLLQFPEGTAGSMMDPTVLALPADLTAEQSQAHLRASPEQMRYNLYVLDREHVLVGVLNLRELFLARRKDLLGAIANRNVLSIQARADRHAVLTHPAWSDAHSIPVVDAKGVYLGAIRYRTLRRLEEELREGRADGAASTAGALGDLFSTGIASVFGAMATSIVQPFPGDPKRDS